jgi:hypothetical protein
MSTESKGHQGSIDDIRPEHDGPDPRTQRITVKSAFQNRHSEPKLDLNCNRWGYHSIQMAEKRAF